MSDAILVLNAGSSSLKFSVFAVDGGTPTLRLRGAFEELNGDTRFRGRNADGGDVDGAGDLEGRALGHDGALDRLFPWLRRRFEGTSLLAVGHRVVHGGDAFAEPAMVDGEVLEALDALVPLAPLHQPQNLVPIRLLAKRRPELPQVACFDTAFHSTIPHVARSFALPAEVSERGVRRYGFHGLSYDYVASMLPSVDARAAAGRTVVLHLGNGASMCALEGGRSVATTMGFTALDGLPMGTRSGQLDPGVVLYLMDELGLDARGVEDLLYRRSGLLGVSGVSSDMRVLLESDDPRARFAVELFVYRIGRELGSLAAALGGLDAVVFTAGIGEHAAAMREAVCRRAAWLGVEIDPAANARDGPKITTSASATAGWVIPTNEEVVIARQTLGAVATAVGDA